MPRTKLEEQARYEFHYPVTLYPRDINYGGHLGNDSLVSLIGNARVEMFRTMGISEGDLGDGKTGIIMADLVVNFKAEAFVFDELEIDSHVGELRSGGFRIFQRITKKGAVIAFVETGVATFDYASRRIAHVPEMFMKKLEGIQKS